MNPFLSPLGAILTALSIYLLVRQWLILSLRTRVQGTLLRIEEVTDFGLTDSMQCLVVRYKDAHGATKECKGRARVTFGWYTIGQQVPVYLSSHSSVAPLVGDFQELWLLPLCVLSLGLLCLALGSI